VRPGRNLVPTGQHVVMLHGSSLMAGGLEALLRSYPRLDVRCINLEEPDAWERLRESEPAVVLVESAGLERGRWLALWRLLEEYRDLPIILVHPSEDTVSIYSKHLVPINDSEDLVSAIVGSIARSQRAAEPGRGHAVQAT
jgi:muconolactone delta-isomerase